MKAEIVSIGTELLLGTINDTNAQYLAQHLAGLGIDCYYVSQVGDNLGRMTEVLQRAWERSDLTITTGGLGPTADDLTRESIAALLGETPEVVPELEKSLRSFFARRGVKMPEQNIKQATILASASIIPNPIGTAPGWWVRRDTPNGKRAIVSMPGVPYEMKRMWEQEVEPELAKVTGAIIVSRTIKTLGIGESAAEELVADLMEGTNPTLAPYAKQDGVYLRMSAKAANRETALEMIAPLERSVRQRLGIAVYGVDEDTPASVIAELLNRANVNLAIAEIGEGAAGSVTRYFAGNARLIKNTNSDIGVESLVDAASALMTETGAEVALALSVMQEPIGDNGMTVKFDAEICLLARTQVDSDGKWRLKQSSQTAKGEVPRLVGLAALNLLRRYLLERLENRK